MSSELGPGSAFGPYRIESQLGRGGMSVVYLAEDTRLGRRVAIKVLAPELAADEAFRSRFVRESQLAAGLEHPNIVPVYDAGETDGHLYIAMRYVRGTDLRTLISRDGPLDTDRTVALLRPVGAALDTAHRRGLVHRDVKPANILVAIEEDEEHVYLSDFGLTKHTSSRSGLTRTGQFMGTVDYVAPEQIQGEDIDGRADGYSLACVLYECLTARVPFAKDTDVATLFGHIQDPPPSVTAVRPDLSSAIDDVVTAGMAKDPAERPRTCSALIDDAARALGAPSGPRDVPGLPPVPTTPPQGSAPPVAPPPDVTPPPTSFPPVTPPEGLTPAPSTAPPPAATPPAATSRPPAGRAGGSNTAKVVAAFAGAGVAVAVAIVLIGSMLGGEDGPGPRPSASPTVSPTPPPPVELANPEPITIVDAADATPYPSTIEVTGADGTVAAVTVTIEGLTHDYVDDVDVLLVGPAGEAVTLMTDVGGGSDNGVIDVTLTFDDAAGRGLADQGQVRSGTFRPTFGSDAGGGLCCDFQGGNPAPTPPYATTLDVFAGTDPNGTWSLFVADDTGGDEGRIARGWSLRIELGEGGPRPTSSPTAPVTGPSGPTGAEGFTTVFTDDFSDPTSGWDVFDDPNTTGGYENGEYVLSVVGGFQVTGDFNTSTQALSELGDVRVEATGRLLQGANAVYGLVCRATSPTSYYYFLVQGDGSYYIGESTAETAENLDTGTSPAIVTGLQPNRIVAECIDGPDGVTLRMSVNGVAVNTVVDSEDPLGPGATGFRAESQRGLMAAAFDDFAVSTPT